MEVGLIGVKIALQLLVVRFVEHQFEHGIDLCNSAVAFKVIDQQSQVFLLLILLVSAPHIKNLKASIECIWLCSCLCTCNKQFINLRCASLGNPVVEICLEVSFVALNRLKQLNYQIEIIWTLGQELEAI